MNNESTNNPENQATNGEGNNTPEEKYSKRGKNALSAANKNNWGPFSRKVGKIIRSLREAKGLSANKLAKEAWVRQGHIWHIEDGTANPTIYTIECISSSLGISLAEFFDENLIEDLTKDEALMAVYKLNKKQMAALSSLLETIPQERQEEGRNEFKASKRKTTTKNTKTEKEEKPMVVGDRIISLRKKMGIECTAHLAHKAHMEPSNLLKIENGTTNPTLNTIESICKALNVSLVEFFAEETNGSLKNNKTFLAINQLNDNQKTALISFLRAMGNSQ